MCGLAGKVCLDGRGAPVRRSLLLAMVSAIGHRGPDEHGIYRDDRAGLAHARLSLVDLESGQQPMGDAAGETWLAFNGEIFNHGALRDELRVAGRTFRTRSDTEVILQAFAEWGTDCFRRFNGQWAVALWNSFSGELVLARDHIGICPLYVHEHGATVTFASEIKALFADPDVPRAFDPAGIDQTFTYWSPLAPKSVFAGIEELRPGTWRRYGPAGRRAEAVFWAPSYPEAGAPAPWTIDDAAEVLEHKLGEATRLRMISADVPVGAYLSGGLDSSLIARLGRGAATGEFRTFSLAFDDDEFDERPYQQAMAATLDSRHDTIVVSRNDIARVFPDVVAHAERPVLRTAPAPMFLLSQIVRDAGIKSVLTGEGADEALAGYDIFREAKIREFWSRRPDSKIRPMLFDRIYPYLARSPARAKGMAQAFWGRGLDRVGRPGWSHDPRWWTTSTIKRMFSADFAEAVAATPPPDPLAALPEQFGSWASLSQAQYLEVTTLLSPYLLSAQGDRMLLAHSVEGRFPFLDRDVIEFCNSLPPQYKLAHLDEKHLLKRVAVGLVPDEIVHRKKQPYRAPDATAFIAGGALVDYVDAALSPESVAEAEVFDPSAVNGLVRKARRLAADPTATFGNTDNMALVGILSTQLLHRMFVCDEHLAAIPSVDVLTDVDRTTSRPE